jgi:hypothetical protein
MLNHSNKQIIQGPAIMLALYFIKEKTMGKRRVILSRDIENLERQEMNRAKIRYHSNNFDNRNWSLILAYVLSFLFTTMLFIGGFIALLLT